MENLVFTLNRKEQPVTIDGKDYKLKELTGRQRDIYFNDLGKRVKFVDGKAAGMNSYEGLHSKLLSLCLYDENNILVKEDIIQDFPSSVTVALYKHAQKLSGLEEESVAEVKND